ncbi:MAG: DUF1538 domain-containing protein [Defluviitaleaceae bacterium]|nr:DUF1538 domain-containing protein [Defluviitaleaceae bacterium]
MNLLRVFKETFIMSAPLAVIIFIVCVFVAPMQDPFDYVRLAVGYAGVVVGQTLFLVGLDMSILPIGEIMGRNLIKLKNFVLIAFFGLVFGLLATVAEPALAVLARQTHILIEEVHEIVFIWVMGAGVGVFVAFSLIRIVKEISIKLVFALLYAAIFIMVIFVPQEFVALAFDGSGATTGDVSVPFILALGLGVSATLAKLKAVAAGPDKSLWDDDSTFGIIGIASVGPILAVFIYGMVLNALYGTPTVNPYDPVSADTSFIAVLLSNVGNIALAVVPLLVVFLPFQFLLIKMPRKDLIKILIGIIPVFAGLLIFLSSIDFGFAFAGKYIGETFLDPSRPSWFRWILLPLSFVLGAAITLTEPAVTVLGDKLEEITGKRIKRMTIRMTLALGIGAAAVLAVIKIITQTNILLFLAPLYAVALIMMKFTPKLFVGLAFDSGGVTGGALTSALLTPLTLGIAQAVATEAGPEAQSVLTNGFGIIAFISVTPLIAVQILGMYAAKHGTPPPSQ